ncbi:MAG: OmpA family protein [Desulfobacterales bacterium]|nr:OmpA family protein [Desulfobacterales bacterium]MCP4158981.1 OmpA family protein [Deltaproteobacteria bacterium]
MKWQIRLLSIIIIVSMVFFVSCGTKSTTEDDNIQVEQKKDEPKKDEVKKDENKTEKKDVVKKDEPKKEEPKKVKKEVEDKVTKDINKAEKKKVGVDIKNIYFEFDSFVLTGDAQDALKKKYDWLTEETDINVEIQGHCDERGTTEYNIALGQKRADRTKEFLINMGIDSSRITTVSFGEEQATKAGTAEEWVKNRRAYFEQK